MEEKKFFQDYMAAKNCFGCGPSNDKGFHIRSYWDGELSVCEWQPEKIHEGWAGLTCGGVIATIVDCHCIATSIAVALKNEGRELGTEPHYTFATGSLNITYLKPSSVESTIRLEAKVVKIKYDKKYTVECDVFVDGEKTAHAEVVTLLVFRSDKPEEAPEVFRPAS